MYKNISSIIIFKLFLKFGENYIILIEKIHKITIISKLNKENYM
jgi:hypothetical protein